MLCRSLTCSYVAAEPEQVVQALSLWEQVLFDLVLLLTNRIEWNKGNLLLSE